MTVRSEKTIYWSTANATCIDPELCATTLQKKLERLAAFMATQTWVLIAYNGLACGAKVCNRLYGNILGQEIMSQRECELYKVRLLNPFFFCTSVVQFLILFSFWFKVPIMRRYFTCLTMYINFQLKDYCFKLDFRYWFELSPCARIGCLLRAWVFRFFFQGLAETCFPMFCWQQIVCFSVRLATFKFMLFFHWYT